jgi:hypothetical protein
MDALHKVEACAERTPEKWILSIVGDSPKYFISARNQVGGL